jgi:hypothetical protein
MRSESKKKKKKQVGNIKKNSMGSTYSLEVLFVSFCSRLFRHESGALAVLLGILRCKRLDLHPTPHSWVGWYLYLEIHQTSALNAST